MILKQDLYDALAAKDASIAELLEESAKFAQRSLDRKIRIELLEGLLREARPCVDPEGWMLTPSMRKELLARIDSALTDKGDAK